RTIDAARERVKRRAETGGCVPLRGGRPWRSAPNEAEREGSPLPLPVGALPVLGFAVLMGVDRDSKQPDAVGIPPAPNPAISTHVQSAWRSWLSALATDAEAAMAAALAYESLPPEARDAWLDALDVDAPTLEVPRVALFAPLLAVEADTVRR